MAKLKPKILVAASDEERARELAEALSFVRHETEIVVGRQMPASLPRCKLLIWEGTPQRQRPEALIDRLPHDAHVVLALSKLDVRWVSYYLQDKRTNHFLHAPAGIADLCSIVDKLATGAIFGVDRYLPSQAELHYRRFARFKERLAVLEEIEALVQHSRMRGHMRRSAVRVAEELMMNAMYQAPVDGEGRRIFEEIEPAARIRRRTPLPVSVRYAVDRGAVYLCVRDRFGSFSRDDLARCLLRCVTEDAPIEQKKLGAGLGLYLVASTVSRLIVNIMPGRVSEIICVLEPATAASSQLKLVSVTVQRPSVHREPAQTPQGIPTLG